MTSVAAALHPAFPCFQLRGPALLPPAVPVLADSAQQVELVAGEGGTDWQVLEAAVAPEEVHSERQVVGSQPFQLRRAGASPALQLTNTPLLWSTYTYTHTL